MLVTRETGDESGSVGSAQVRVKGKGIEDRWNQDGFALSRFWELISLCLCVSVVCFAKENINHRGTDTEKREPVTLEARLTRIKVDGNTVTRHKVWFARAVEEAGVHADCGALARAGHRRKHGDF